jgi:hypothetical protein
MRKNQVMLRLTDEELAFVDAQARLADWSRAKYVGKLVRQAQASMESGQAREMEAALAEGRRAVSEATKVEDAEAVG